MIRDNRPITSLDQMSPEQQYCRNMFCRVVGGAHRVNGTWRSFGAGLKVSVIADKWATFDFDYLTRLVFAAHDAGVRVEIIGGVADRIQLSLYRRTKRDGSINERHPTLEQAVADWRVRNPEAT